VLLLSKCSIYSAPQGQQDVYYNDIVEYSNKEGKETSKQEVGERGAMLTS